MINKIELVIAARCSYTTEAKKEYILLDKSNLSNNIKVDVHASTNITRSSEEVDLEISQGIITLTEFIYSQKVENSLPLMKVGKCKLEDLQEIRSGSYELDLVDSPIPGIYRIEIIPIEYWDKEAPVRELLFPSEAEMPMETIDIDTEGGSK